MQKIEKPKRATSPEAKKPVGVRLSPKEREELQAGADSLAGGNLGLYIRTMALERHRDYRVPAGSGEWTKSSHAGGANGDTISFPKQKNPAQGGRDNVESCKKKER
ncbi:MAG: hypothetical protein WC130_04915 [Kiritimatiellia bacterium]